MELIVREDLSIEVLHFYSEDGLFCRDIGVCFGEILKPEQPDFVKALLAFVEGIETVCLNNERMTIVKKSDHKWEDMIAYVLGVLEGFLNFDIVRIDFMHDKEAEGEVILEGYISAYFKSASMSKKRKVKLVM